ncbi:MAG TPA: OmpA family protein [Gemmatimonadales bacterium]|nr:OmpA family protein [Gemmatimonadales bacterium]
MRVTVPASAVVLSALLTVPAAAQRPGTIELGALVQYTRYDPSLLLNDGIGVGGTLAVWVARGFAVEGSAAYSAPGASPAGSVKEIPLRLRLLYGAPAAPTTTVLFGAGYVHHAVRDGASRWEDGITGLFGARLDLTPHLAVRVAAVGDYFPSPLNEGPGVQDNWNFALQAGLDVLIGKRGSGSTARFPTAIPAPTQPPPTGVRVAPPAAPARDSDSDGVPDSLDKCLGTPLGDPVDANGCSLPKDSDGDGVIDARDQCAGTSAGVKVDANGCPIDSDGDGVADAVDKCPNTPAGDTVDASGCSVAKDADGDGVPDASDRCPQTPAGRIVDGLGCPLLFTGGSRTLILQGVTFQTGSAVLAAASFGTLDQIAASLRAHPEIRIEIAGYTDDQGALADNRRLSQARADAVRAYLIRQSVGPGQLTARGFGSANPRDSNLTAAGRARNRRVELHRIG